MSYFSNKFTSLTYSFYRLLEQFNLANSQIKTVSIDYWSNLTLLTAELKPALICLTQTKRDMSVNGLMFLSFNLSNAN